MSQLKSHLEEPDQAATLPVFPAGGLTAGGNNATLTGAGENPFKTQKFVLNQHVTQSRSCMLHSKPLRYFCDSCEELLCYDCTVMGPHNTQLHRICNMEEAFRYRFETINKSIHNSLVPKRAQLIGQIVRLDHRLDEIKTVKGVIDRDIRNEYAGIMERLRSAEGVKTAVLQHDIAEV
jgi:palmitoyltransferase